jgi:hypothetical protein
MLINLQTSQRLAGSTTDPLTNTRSKKYAVAVMGKKSKYNLTQVRLAIIKGNKNNTVARMW